ncbi:MAG: SPOR domain-containing protein [Deltaproteobacteria bacterium]|nr:SPOR domain-containing protein [Deltaproteobacteria bacterium]
MALTKVDHFKDAGVDVRLESRQVFLLFFGGAISACLVFALGVMVGRRLEQKSVHAGTARAAAPPLAAMDRMSAAEAEAEDEVAGAADDGLSFHRQLASGATAPDPLTDPIEAPVRKPAAAKPAAPVASAKPVAPAPVASAKPVAPAPVASAKPVAPAPVASAKPLAAAPPVASARPAPAEPAPVASARPAASPAASPAAAASPVAPARPVPAARPAGDSKPVAGNDGAGAALADDANQRFTLQLPTIPEKADADAMLARLGAAGYRPRIVAAPGDDGRTWYRIRLGDFASRAEAVTAKAEFERKHHVIAYVARN